MPKIIYDPPFDISHLAEGEQNRIRYSGPTHEEQFKISRGKNPWRNPYAHPRHVNKEELSKLLRGEPLHESTPSTAPRPSRIKLGLGALAAVGVLVVAIGGAYQMAGVINVALAHVLIFVGWVGFNLSSVFVEHVLSIPFRRAIKVGIVVASLSGFFCFGADRLMVYLKANQIAEERAKSLATPTPMSDVRQAPSPTVRPSTTASPSEKLRRGRKSSEVPCSAEDRLLGRC